MKDREMLKRVVEAVFVGYGEYIANGYRNKDAYESAVRDGFKHLSRKLDKEEADFILDKLAHLREGIYGEEAYNEF